MTKSTLFKSVLLWNNNYQFIETDLLVENGFISKIEPNINLISKNVINGKGLILSEGFVDMHVHFRDPGQTHKETVQSGSMAAARGGFTKVFCMPNTNPVLDNLKSLVELERTIQSDAAINVQIMPAMTLNLKGEVLSDFKKLKNAGYNFLTDDGFGLENDQLMEEAFKLAGELDLVIVQHAEFKHFSNGGVIHLGSKSKELGLNGISSESEYKMVERDIKLSEKYDVHYHVQHVSTLETVSLIREAKRKNLRVTCEVTPHHLVLTDQDIGSIKDTNFKMNPPLRDKSDREALWNGLIDDTIDIIATDHAPHGLQDKGRSMDLALHGVTGLETAFSVLYTELVLNKIITLEKLLEKLTVSPRKVFNLDDSSDLIGKQADLVLIDLNREVQVDQSWFVSKSINSPFVGRIVKGQPVLTMVGGEVVWNEK